MTYGRYLLEFRAEHNLTQAELSVMLGVSVGMINRYEADKNSPTAANKIRFTKKLKDWEAEHRES